MNLLRPLLVSIALIAPTAVVTTTSVKPAAAAADPCASHKKNVGDSWNQSGEEALIKAGYTGITADGKVTNGNEQTTIKVAQQDLANQGFLNAWPLCGIPGNATKDAANAKAKAQGGTPTTTAPTPASNSSTDCDLRTGPHQKAIEEGLKKLGYSITVDGTQSEADCSIIKEFQSKYGITPVKGFAGPKTLAKVQELTGTPANTCAYKPSLALPANSGSGARIVIQQSTNHVWIVDRNNCPTADGGIVDNPKAMPKGTYNTYTKYPSDIYDTKIPAPFGDDVNGTPDLELPLYIGFRNVTGLSDAEKKAQGIPTWATGLGFHGIPIQMHGENAGEQIHGDGLLGTNQAKSGGCIRVSQSMIQKLADFVRGRSRTVVVV